MDMNNEVKVENVNTAKAEDAVRKILLITFTDAGCREMKTRVASKLEKAGLCIDPENIQAKTFNSLAYEIVQDRYQDLGFTAVPRVIDKIRNRRIITELLDQTVIPGLDYLHFKSNMKNAKGALAVSEKAFDLIKTMRLDPMSQASVEPLFQGLINAGLSAFFEQQSVPELLQIYVDYADRLIQENLLTFADQEPMMNRILEMNPGYFNKFGYEHIIVDEFQDSNDVQMDTIRKLCECPCFKSLMVVGDDSQSIFGFRNTSPENILKFFEKIGKKGQDLYMFDNYRSTPEILDLANKINALNEHRMEKDLVSKRESGAKPIIHGFETAKDEYTYIANTMKQLIEEKGFFPDEIAFIAATNAELAKMSAALTEAEIPWVMMNPMVLSKNSKVQAAQALADGIREPEATQHFFSYLCAKYDGKIKDIAHEEIQEEIGKLKNLVNATFYGMGDEALSFEAQRNTFHRLLEDIKGTDEIYEYFLELVYANPDLQSELQYMLDFRNYGEDEAKRMSQTYQGVVLTTAHSSKGLEWRVVFNSLSGYDNAILHQKKHADDLEEKRRLLFVSLTRARDLLFVTGQFVAYKEKTEGKKVAGENNDVYNQFLREVYQESGNADRFSAELLAMKQRQAAKEEEARKKRNERNRERYAKKKALGNASKLSNNLPGQLSFV